MINYTTMSGLFGVRFCVFTTKNGAVDPVTAPCKYKREILLQIWHFGVVLEHVWRLWRKLGVYMQPKGT